MTTSETQKRWRRDDRLRRASYRKWDRVWREYYLRQGRILLNNMTEVGFIFPIEEVEALFMEMYKDVASTFAVSGYLTAKSGFVDMVTKADEIPPNFMLTWGNQIESYVLANCGESIVSVSSTARERAMAIIKEATDLAVEQGLGELEAARLIEDMVWDEWKITSKFNAARIARTEIISASNESAFIGAQSTGLPLKKVWLTAMDGRERAAHADANGQTRDMNQPFDVGFSQMSKPGDKKAPAGEVINCRCSIAFTTQLF